MSHRKFNLELGIGPTIGAAGLAAVLLLSGLKYLDTCLQITDESIKSSIPAQLYSQSRLEDNKYIRLPAIIPLFP